MKYATSSVAGAMDYISTRGDCEAVGFRDAVRLGLAPDGGLFLPRHLPDFSDLWSNWQGLTYIDLCTEFLGTFADDIEIPVLRGCIERAYSSFDPPVARLLELNESLHVFELFHGPTLAFKDFALQLLGELYAEQIRRTNQPLTVLGATSGDTGAAAIQGLRGKPGVRIFILYPEGRISPLQERQMVCIPDENVHAIAIKGNFDDAQRIVKALFGDADFRTKQNLSAVNSINLARILAQSVYYVFAFLQLPPERRNRVEFIVPTGNFGNVLAGWLVQKMGIPIKGFRIATNENDILYRFFQTGEYQRDAVQATHAPSMDIQEASNFERYLYYALKQDSVSVREAMRRIRTTGFFKLDNFEADSFTASRSSNGEIEGVIKAVYDRFQYIVDPHTACGFKGLLDEETYAFSESVRIILATAHPAKFPETVERAIGIHPRAPSLEALKQAPVRKTILPADEKAIQRFIEDA